MLKRGEVVVALESKKQGAGLRIYIDGPRLTGWLNTKANDGAPILLPVREKVASAVGDQDEADSDAGGEAVFAGGKAGATKGGMFGRGGGGGGVFGSTGAAVQAAAKLRRGGAVAGRGGRGRGRGAKQEFTIKVQKWPRGRVKMMYRGLLVRPRATVPHVAVSLALRR